MSSLYVLSSFYVMSSLYVLSSFIRENCITYKMEFLPCRNIVYDLEFERSNANMEYFPAKKRIRVQFQILFPLIPQIVAVSYKFLTFLCTEILNFYFYFLFSYVKISPRIQQIRDFSQYFCSLFFDLEILREIYFFYEIFYNPENQKSWTFIAIFHIFFIIIFF